VRCELGVGYVNKSVAGWFKNRHPSHTSSEALLSSSSEAVSVTSRSRYRSTRSEHAHVMGDATSA